MLRKFEQSFDLRPSRPADGERKYQEECVDHDPACILPTQGDLVENYVDADRTAFFDGHGECQVRYPDENVPGKFFAPDRRARGVGEVGYYVSVSGLEGDEEDYQQ